MYHAIKLAQEHHLVLLGDGVVTAHGWWACALLREWVGREPDTASSVSEDFEEGWMLNDAEKLLF